MNSKLILAFLALLLLIGLGTFAAVSMSRDGTDRSRQPVPELTAASFTNGGDRNDGAAEGRRGSDATPLQPVSDSNDGAKREDSPAVVSPDREAGPGVDPSPNESVQPVDDRREPAAMSDAERKAAVEEFMQAMRKRIQEEEERDAADPGFATISGIVCDARYVPVQGITVNARIRDSDRDDGHAAGPFFGLEVGMSGADGYFLGKLKSPRLAKAKTVAVTLSIHAGLYMQTEPVSISLERGEHYSSAMVIVAKLGTVRGRLVDDQGIPAADLDYEVVRAGDKKSNRIGSRVNDGGGFSWGGLQPGTYEVVPTSPGWKVGTGNKFDVVADEEIDLGDVVLERTTAVVFTFEYVGDLGVEAEFRLGSAKAKKLATRSFRSRRVYIVTLDEPGSQVIHVKFGQHKLVGHEDGVFTVDVVAGVHTPVGPITLEQHRVVPTKPD